MATKHTIEGRHLMIVKGAVDVLLNRMDRIHINGEIRSITEADKQKIEAQNQEFSREGLRVLGFAYKEIPADLELTVDHEDGLIFLGLIDMMDPPREESKAAVEECKRAGIRPIMITGDHKVTAAAIAKNESAFFRDESEACEGAGDRFDDR